MSLESKLLGNLHAETGTIESVQQLDAIREEYVEMNDRLKNQVALIAVAKEKLKKLNAICDANPDDPDKIRKQKRESVALEITIEAESQMLNEIDVSLREINHRSQCMSNLISSGISAQVGSRAHARLDAARQRIREETRRFCLLHYIAHGPGSSSGAEYELEMIAIDSRYLYGGADQIIADVKGRISEEAREAA